MWKKNTKLKNANMHLIRNFDISDFFKISYTAQSF